MYWIWILFGLVLSSGIVLTCWSYHKGLVGISRLVVDTEMGRSLVAVSTGIIALCSILTLREVGSFHLLAFALIFELCALFSATLGVALYPIMIRSAFSVYSRAAELSADISSEASEIFQKHGYNVSEDELKDILESRMIIEQIIKQKKKGAGFWVCFLILIYYYTFLFALFGIVFLTVGIGIAATQANQCLANASIAI